jgi:peroxiredoxin
VTPRDPDELPPDLPVPADDGAADHLEGMRIPPVALPSTDGGTLDVGAVPGTLVLYVYPKAGRPGVDPPPEWDAIPGARGCTPQSCAFRDHHAELRDLGVTVVGLSTQSTGEQQAFVADQHLPFTLVSDANLEFARALDLPTFEFDDVTLLKRITLIARDGEIVKVFYPVFPPDQNAQDVIDWLALSSSRGKGEA